MTKRKNIICVDPHFGELAFAGAWEGKVEIPVHGEVDICIDVEDFSSAKPSEPSDNQRHVFRQFCEGLAEISSDIDHVVHAFYQKLHEKLKSHDHYDAWEIPDVHMARQVGVLMTEKPSLHLLNQPMVERWRVILHHHMKLDKEYCVDVVLSEKGVEGVGLGGEFYGMNW